MKKPPVIEFEIPKRIFTAEETTYNSLGELMMQVFEMAE
jgi:U3 small nucleolar RNA-associated protein 19